MNTAFTGTTLSPVELVVLQGTSFCNLNCTYCDLTPDSRRTRAVMAPGLIDKFFAQLFESGHAGPEVTVVWHSGEPLTLPPSYYDDAIELILRLRDARDARHVAVRFAIQTNAVLIDEAWCRFFARHRDHLDLGVSCDGPSDLHDAYRLNWTGRATHARTVRGMDLLHAAGIKYKMIAVVTRKTLRQPEAFYQFFFERRAQLSGFHFNIVADSRSSNPDLAYSADDRGAYYAFYRRLLELTHAAGDAGHDFEILNFSHATRRILASSRPGAPIFFAETTAPLKSINLDASGNVTTFYAGLSIDTLRDEYGDGRGLSLGNLIATSLEDMARSPKLQRIMQDFAASRRACEDACEYFTVCSGGYDILKKQSYGTFAVAETVECLIHVKTLTDAILDDIGEYSTRRSPPRGEERDGP